MHNYIFIIKLNIISAMSGHKNVLKILHIAVKR